jgi:hypothetical protein
MAEVDKKLKSHHTTIDRVDNGQYAQIKTRARGTGAISFLQKLRPDGPWVVTAIKGTTITETFTEAEEARGFIATHNRAGANVYYTANVCRVAMASKPKKADIATVEFLHVDADPAKDESPEEFKERMQPVIDQFEPKPTFEIDSGNGLQFLWQLQPPVEITSDEVIADIEARNFSLAERLGADPSTRNIDRLLRLPSTTNFPNKTKLKLGRVKCWARWLEDNDIAHPLDAFPPKQAEESPRQTKRATGSTRELPQQLLTMLHVPGSGAYQTRSELLFAFLRAALRANVADEIIIAACLDRAYEGGGIYQHVVENDGQDYLARQIARAREKISDTTNNIHSWDEPDVSMLDDRRGDLPTFPLGALYPDQLQERIQQLADGSGTSFAHVAVPLLGVASSLIGISRRVEASSSFLQPMTCWTALVAYSGEGKTPGINVTRKALAHIDRRQEIAQLKREHERKAALAKASKDKWKKDFDETFKKHKPVPPPPAEADDPGSFIEPRLSVTDITVERMGELMQARPHGMLLLNDELGGWFRSMNQYKGGVGGDNSFWLSCWDGDSYTIERKSCPPANIDHLLVGIVGGLQPDKIHDVFKGPADGMYARFLFAWPDKPPYRQLRDDTTEIDPMIVELLDQLDRLRERKVAYLKSYIRLSPLARKAFERFRREQYASADALDGREREWWAKAQAHVLRLAGTLCLMRWAVDGDKEPTAIRSKYVKAAVQLVRDYFWPHARACLRQIGLSERHVHARRVLRWIKANNKQQVRREDIRRNALSQLLDADQTDELLKGLARAGWLRKVEDRHRGPGPKKQAWQVNPQLLSQQAERR